MAVLNDRPRNRLLAALPLATWRHWLPEFERMDLNVGQLLFEPGVMAQHVYFPTSAIVSLLGTTEDGASAEIAMVGSEGMVGVPLILGDSVSHTRAVVLCAGQCWRMKAPALLADFNRGGVVMQVLMRYTLALMSQVSQTAVCNRHHCVQAQLCRWLLTSLDRLPTPHLYMTQELMASMLGVRREGVTEAALKLQREGLIQYARGHITVLNRQGLEAKSCECYSVVKREYDRLLPDRLAA